ncbi:MAG: Hsp20/alpha crystallin family protein [Eubacteriales bacterium]|nr:Hsp20/alpha crystallin family protein [Eubacteriales bacterium]
MRISYPRSTMPATRYDYPPFDPEERLLLRGQGAFRSTPSGGWRPAQAFLTDQRLILYLRPKILTQVLLPSIRSLSVERRYCILKIRDTLRISYLLGRPRRPASLWFVVNGLRLWKEKIHQLSILDLDEKTIQDLALRLDVDGQQVLWRLWEKRHASIRELAAVIGAEDLMDVLRVIRETINPAAEKLLGCPVLVFERSMVHPRSHEPVHFHWWLVGKENRCARNPERLLDIFDEGDRLVVILGVQGAEISDIRLDMDEDRLTVRSHRIGAAMRVRIPLPHPVLPEGVGMRLKNGLLEIAMAKV